MKLFGSLKELVSLVMRKDTKEITLSPNQSITYGQNTDVQLPKENDTAAVLLSRESVDQGADRLKNKDLEDSTVAFVDQGDATKKMQFEVSGVTTGTTRTLTVPDADLTLVGTATTQALQNKSLEDSTTFIIDNADNTKKAKFQVSGVTTGTTREFTFPDEDTTLVGTGANQIITNKKLVDASVSIVDDGDTTKQIKFQASGITTGTTRTITMIDEDLTIVGRTNTQTITGKTIDGDDNTVQDLPLTSIKTVLADAGKFLARDGSGIPVSTNLVPSGTVVGTTDSQALSAKTLSDMYYDSANVSISSNSFATQAASVLRITAGTGPLNTITGASNGSMKAVVNQLGSSLTITNNSGASGFYTGTGADLTIQDKASIIVIYNSTTSRWNVVGGSGGGSGGLSLSNISSSGTAAVSTHYLADTSGGGFTLTLPSGTGGATIWVSDVSRTWGTNNLTVATTGGQTINGDTSLICDVSGTWVQFLWNGTEWKTDDPFIPNLNNLTGDVTIAGNVTITGDEIFNDSSAKSVTVASGYTMWHPNLTIASGHTYTINGRFLSENTVTVNGTLTVNGTMRVI